MFSGRGHTVSAETGKRVTSSRQLQQLRKAFIQY